MVEPVSTMAIITSLFSVADKLLDKIPGYAERERKSYLKLKKNFEVYKDTPIHKRVNRYLFNLHKELVNHVGAMVEAIK